MKTISTISILLLGTFISFGQVAETIRSASGKEPVMQSVVGATSLNCSSEKLNAEIISVFDDQPQPIMR